MDAVGMIVGFLPHLVLGLAFVVVVAVWSRGRVRTLGVAAGVVLLVGSVLGQSYSLLIPTLVQELGLPFSLVGLFSSVFLLFQYVGLGLIAAALVIGGRAAARGPALR